MPRGNVRVSITGDADGLSRATVRANQDLARFGDKGSKSLGRLKAAAIGAGAALGVTVVAATKGAIKAAVEAEVSQKKLRAQLDASGISWRKHADEIDRVIQKHSQLSGLDDEDLQDAFTNIVRVTGEVDKSLRLTGLAADFARAKHMDVAKAGEIVGKVAGGNIGILARYGIVTKDGATATEALGALQKRFAGQAKAYGETTAGSSDRLSVAFENLGEKLGKKLLPYITTAAEWLVKFITEMENGEGAGGKFRHTLEDIATTIGDVIGWIKRAIRNVNAWGDATRRHVIDVWTNVKVVFGNVMAFILRRFGDLFDVASHLPGIGGKFGDLRDKANALADKIDRAGEKTKKLGHQIDLLPTKKEIDLIVKLQLADLAAGKVKPLVSNPGQSDGWGIEGLARREVQRGLDNGSIDPFGFPLGGDLLGANLMGANANLGPFAAIGSRMGLHVSSGYRPGAITSSGNLSYHAQHRAIDMADGPAAMLAYAKVMAAGFGGRLKELIHTPLGFSIKNGQRVAPYATADHYDHVHVALQRGGMVPGSGTGDKVPVLAEPGEGFINSRAVRALGGESAIDAINRMFPRFQNGGMVKALHALHRVGATGEEEAILGAIAGAESGWRFVRGDGGKSWTPWQIHMTDWADDIKRMGINIGTWGGAAKMALWIKRNTANGYGNWTMYNNGQYRNYLDDVEKYVSGGKDTTPGRRGRRGRLTPRSGVLKGGTKKATSPYGGIGKGGILNAFMDFQSGRLNQAAALAELTPDMADDIAAAQDAVSTWATWLDIAKQNKDTAGITTAAQNLKQAQDNLASLTAPGEESNAALEANTAAIEEQNKLLAEQNALAGEIKAIEKQKLGLVQSQGPALLLALAGISNNWIGGNAGLGKSFPSFAGLGGLART